MDVIHYTPSGKFKYIHVVIDTHSSFVYASVQIGEKAIQTMKALKMVMLVIGMPWAIETSNSPAYPSQISKDFLQNWGIPYNP